MCSKKLNDAYDKFIGVENTNLKELEEKLESEESELILFKQYFFFNTKSNKNRKSFFIYYIIY